MASPEQLRFARVNPEPDGIVFPVGPEEQGSGMLVVEENRQLEITEAGLIGIRPEELVGRSKNPLQHEAILNQPALQILIFEGVVVIGYRAQSGRAR
jgi:hypothetical protein